MEISLFSFNVQNYVTAKLTRKRQTSASFSNFLESEKCITHGFSIFSQVKNNLIDNKIKFKEFLHQFYCAG